MKPEDIKKELNQYIRIKNPNYAVEITGDWGTGKTYFIKDYIEYLRKLPSQKIIYLSLYGIEDESAIEKHLWLQIVHSSFRGIENRAILCLSALCLIMFLWIMVRIFTLSVVFPVALHIIETTSLVFIAVALWIYGIMKKTILQIILGNVDLIVFDDFERAKMSYALLLAYINRYVEHLHKHIVVVCNEKEIEKKDNTQSFSKIQEKVIGKIFVLEQIKESSLEAVFFQGDYGLLRQIINLEGSAKAFFLSRTVPIRTPVNYRVWAICCSDFESIFHSVSFDLIANPKVFKQLLPQFFSLAYALHVHDFGELGTFSEKEAITLYCMPRVNNELDWFDRYFGLQPGTRDILPVSTWKNIIMGNGINYVDVNKHLNLFLEKNPPLWLQLYNYLEKTDDEINELWEQLRQAYQTHSIKDLAQIISIFSSVLDMRINHCCPDPEMTDEKALQLLSNYIASIDIPFEVGVHKRLAEFLDFCKTYGHHQMQSREFMRVKRLFQNAQLEFIKRYVAPLNFNALLKHLLQSEEVFDFFWYEQGMRLSPIFLDKRNARPLLNTLLALSPKAMKERLFAIIDHLSTLFGGSDDDEYISFEEAFAKEINNTLNDKTIMIDGSKRYWLERAVNDLNKDLQDKNSFESLTKPSNLPHLNQ